MSADRPEEWKTTEGRSAFANRPSAFRVSDGTRTRGILDHNQVLYQLSYTHHVRSVARGLP